MHQTRKDAETKYQAALAQFNAAAGGGDEEKFNLAHAALKAARVDAVRAELNFPTHTEVLHAQRILKARNRGLDI